MLIGGQHLEFLVGVERVGRVVLGLAAEAVRQHRVHRHPYAVSVRVRDNTAPACDRACFHCRCVGRTIIGGPTGPAERFMKERDIRDHINAFLKSKLQSLVVPASIGIGIALGGCSSAGLSTNHDGSAGSSALSSGGVAGSSSGGAGGSVTLYGFAGFPAGGAGGSGGVADAGVRGTGGTVYGAGGFIMGGSGGSSSGGTSGASGTVYGGPFKDAAPSDATVDSGVDMLISEAGARRDTEISEAGSRKDTLTEREVQ